MEIKTGTIVIALNAIIGIERTGDDSSSTGITTGNALGIIVSSENGNILVRVNGKNQWTADARIIPIVHTDLDPEKDIDLLEVLSWALALEEEDSPFMPRINLAFKMKEAGLI